jgi:prevent-host-death family protein
METISASKFKEQCLALLDSVGPEGIVITKRGKPVAKLLPMPHDPSNLIGAWKGKVIVVDPEDPLFSTGEWISDEWGDLNSPEEEAADSRFWRKGPRGDQPDDA